MGRGSRDITSYRGLRSIDRSFTVPLPDTGRPDSRQRGGCSDVPSWKGPPRSHWIVCVAAAHGPSSMRGSPNRCYLPPSTTNQGVEAPYHSMVQAPRLSALAARSWPLTPPCSYCPSHKPVVTSCASVAQAFPSPLFPLLSQASQASSAQPVRFGDRTIRLSFSFPQLGRPMPPRRTLAKHPTFDHSSRAPGPVMTSPMAGTFYSGWCVGR